MSHDFKLNYDQLLSGNTGKRENSSEQTGKAQEEFYPSEGHVRNLCFVLLDGRKLFLNYAYLVSGDYSPEEGSITLSYTTHKVIIKGYNIELLFYDLMHHTRKHIICMDTRYNSIAEKESSVVNMIIIQTNE
jgi:hypothetical protein